RTTSVAPTTTSAPTTTARSTTPTPVHQSSTRHAVTYHAPVTRVAGTPCTSVARACVDISRDKAWLISDGKIVLGPVSVTTGKPGHATPTGNFQVLWKDRHHLSHEFDNAPMPYSVFFYPGDAFHTGSLAAESHGCVHLANSTAARFFEFLHVGDPVQVKP
ncbi:MAG: L,D-transpeptidase, partial [Sciscionella sp.]